jgi:transcriptional regulator
MYVPRQFAVADAVASALLAEARVADLVTATGDGLLATLLPFVHDPEPEPADALLGHVARPNDQRPGEAAAAQDVRRFRPR